MLRAPLATRGQVLYLLQNETEMRLEDRVAFACIFLPDSALHEYVRATSAELCGRGALGGVLLTGAGLDALPLLQRWLEATGDVQSVALVAARCFTPDLLRDPRTLNWLDRYDTYTRDTLLLWNLLLRKLRNRERSISYFKGYS
ncbi:hypothetical protein HF086_010157 [Spodoptera exigua]|uniref:Uncharacterized protein n=1 Tax=Spodoptera exigua TaxID=7107 RepID=A0A922MY38_SPOEX|nr:hypothetical protein HF086_010157 [Spodoptera exigua]